MQKNKFHEIGSCKLVGIFFGISTDFLREVSSTMKLDHDVFGNRKMLSNTKLYIIYSINYCNNAWYLHVDRCYVV